MSLCRLASLTANCTYLIFRTCRLSTVPCVLSGCWNISVSVRRTISATSAFCFIGSLSTASRLLGNYFLVIVAKCLLSDCAAYGTFLSCCTGCFRAVPGMLAGCRNISISVLRTISATSTFCFINSLSTTGRLLRNYLLIIMTEGLLSYRATLRTLLISGAGCRTDIPGMSGRLYAYRTTHRTLLVRRAGCCTDVPFMAFSCFANSTTDSTFLVSRTGCCRAIPGMLAGCRDITIAIRRTSTATRAFRYISALCSTGSVLCDNLLIIMAEGLLSYRTTRSTLLVRRAGCCTDIPGMSFRCFSDSTAGGALLSCCTVSCTDIPSMSLSCFPYSTADSTFLRCSTGCCRAIPSVLAGCRNIAVAIRVSGATTRAFRYVSTLCSTGSVLCDNLLIIMAEGLLSYRTTRSTLLVRRAGCCTDIPGMSFRCFSDSTAGGALLSCCTVSCTDIPSMSLSCFPYSTADSTFLRCSTGCCRAIPSVLAGCRNIAVAIRVSGATTRAFRYVSTLCSTGGVLSDNLLIIVAEGLLTYGTTLRTLLIGGTGCCTDIPGVAGCLCVDRTTDCTFLVRRAGCCTDIPFMSLCCFAYSTANRTFLSCSTSSCRAVPSMLAGCRNRSVSVRIAGATTGALAHIRSRSSTGSILGDNLLIIVAEFVDCLGLGLTTHGALIGFRSIRRTGSIFRAGYCPCVLSGCRDVPVTIRIACTALGTLRYIRTRRSASRIFRYNCCPSMAAGCLLLS